MSDEDEDIPPTREQPVRPPHPRRRAGTLQLTDAQLRGEEPVPTGTDGGEPPAPDNPFEDAEPTEPDFKVRDELDTQDMLAAFDDATDVQGG